MTWADQRLNYLVLFVNTGLHNYPDLSMAISKTERQDLFLPSSYTLHGLYGRMAQPFNVLPERIFHSLRSVLSQGTSSTYTCLVVWIDGSALLARREHLVPPSLY